MIEQLEKENKSSKSRIGYGVKPPFLPFEEVIEIVKILGTKAGDKGSIDALSRITGNSRSSSTFNKKVAALKVFTVLKADKSGYTLTELGKKVALPSSFENQAESIIEAFLSQTELRKIWEIFKGKRLPQMEFLENSILDILNIPPELKTTWANYFFEGAKFAGLLEERQPGSYQVLLQYESKYEVPQLAATEMESKKTTIENGNKSDILKLANLQPNSNDFSSLAELSWGIFNTKTVSNNRKAIFAIPEHLTQQDIESLKIFLKGIEVQLDGLKKNDEE